MRQLDAAESRVHGGAEQAGAGEDVEGALHLGDHVDALAVEGGLFGVAALVVRGELFGGHFGREIEDGVEGVAGVLLEARPGDERLGVQPVVQQEVQVTS